MNGSRRYCGRDFTASELEAVVQLVRDHPEANRAWLSRAACEKLGWRRPDGRLKDMSCRVAMLRMQSDGLLCLPVPLRTNGNGKPYCRRTSEADPEPNPVLLTASALSDLGLEPVGGKSQSHLWNEYIERYHDLGYEPLPGAQMRYFARAGSQVLAVLGFGAAAWKAAGRDRFIGWSDAQRRCRLYLVVNNARFLILPWVHSKNLASKLLAMATRRLADDWQLRYGYRPVLVETFVETPRFRGTCYKAANWTQVGQTQGRGKLDVLHIAQLPKKSIWVYPLARDFRNTLCG